MGHLDATATVDWQGFGGEVTGASGALHARTASQIELGGPGGGTNPEELLAAAHANCFTSTLTSLARRHGLRLDRVHTVATTNLDWTEGHGDHELTETRLAVGISTPGAWEDVERLVREAERECPICRAVAGTVRLRVELTRLE